MQLHTTLYIHKQFVLNNEKVINPAPIVEVEICFKQILLVLHNSIMHLYLIKKNLKETESHMLYIVSHNTANIFP